jgi:hypothetical protein
MKLVKTLLKNAAELADFSAWHKGRFGFHLFSPKLASLANVSEGFRPQGLKAYYPIDQPYSLRYNLVCQALSTDTGASTLNSTYGISYDDMCKLYPTNPIQTGGFTAIPLGFMADSPGSGNLDIAPISGTVQLLGGGQTKTIQGIADSIINAGTTLLIPSATTAGYVRAVPSTPGAYYTVGLPISTSEGAGLPIEIDPRPAWIAIQVIT